MSPIIGYPCRRHDNAEWDEASDQWVCERCGFRWAVRRKPDGRPSPHQGWRAPRRVSLDEIEVYPS